MKRKVIVECSKCNKEMLIRLWGAYEWWLNPDHPTFEKRKDYPAPHRNASHPCPHCETLWLSSDHVELVEDTPEHIKLRFVE